MRIDMKRQAGACVGLLFAVLTLFCGLGVAQETTATISGTVNDATGAIIPGAAVEVRNVATGITRSVETDAQGRYTVTQLSPGSYEVQTSMSGFRSSVRSGIELTVGRHAVVDVQLQVGEVTQTVEVAGEAPLVETTSAAMSGLISDKQIRDLPLNGRDFVSLSLLEPGVTQARSFGSGVVQGAGLKLSFNGARPRMNNFIVDGTTANSVNGNSIGGASGQAMGVETIQEFQVLTSNFNAEFGRAGGGIVNVVTKSGTNELHGSVFEFLRNSALDARNFFDGAVHPPFKRNQFGATLGGPIVKDKTFVFGGYEGLRQRLGQTLIANVPTAAARAGTVADTAKPYLNLWKLPTPDGRDFGDGRAQFIHTATETTRQDFGQVRVDHHFSEDDSLFVRYTIDDSGVTHPQNSGNYEQVDKVRSQYGTIAETRIFSPTLLNVLRFGYNRPVVFYQAVPTNPAIEDSSLWYFGTAASSPGLGPLGIANVTDPGVPVNLPRARLDNTYQVTDTLTYTTSSHTVKFGAEFERLQTNENEAFREQGSYTFANLSTFLLGQPASFIGVQPGKSAVRGWRQNLMGLFVQDDVRLKPRLTLNLGLRWEAITDPIEVNGRASHYEDLFGSDTLKVGNPLIKIPMKNFSPRTGFAWDVGGDGKTSVRGGFGMYYQMIFRDHFYASRTLPPFYDTLSGEAATGLVFPHPLSQLSAAGAVLNNAAQYDDNPQPYVMQWNLSVQREVLPSTLVGIGYVGTRGLHLSRQGDTNTPAYTIQPDGRYFYANTTRMDPKFTQVALRTLSATSRYNAMQVKISHRLTGGLQAQAAYTWSHTQDNSSSPISGDTSQTSAPQNPWTINSSEWSHSAYDLRHVLSVNYTYELPLGTHSGVLGKLVGGWQTNGIVSASTGVPFSIQNSGGLNRDRTGGGNASRPDLVPGKSNNPTSGVSDGCAGVTPGQEIGGVDRYYDPCAFKLQDAGYYGSLGRNTVIGPGVATFDFGLTKNTSFGESRSLQFRWEVFNLLNRANFDLPNTTAFSSATGAASSSAGLISAPTSTKAREMQFGLKLTF